MRNSPVRAGRGSFNGHTDWYINWRPQLQRTPYGCQIQHFAINVRVLYTLPALSEYVTEQQTIDVFNQFNNALVTHEKKHGEHGIQAAREIEQAISSLQQGTQRPANCHNIGREIDNIANAIVHKYAQADRDYDRVTNNGMTEGAVIY